MTLQKLFLSATAAAALAFSLAGPASAVTQSVTLSPTYNGPGDYFYITSADSTSVTANFGNTITAPSESFTDYFRFGTTTPSDGSGSVSTSFSSPKNDLTISEVIIYGGSAADTYTLTPSSTPGDFFTNGAGETVSVNDLSILASTPPNAPDYIEIIGTTSSKNTGATFDGTATLISTAPEPAAWLLMVGGIGLTGVMLRRRQTMVAFA